MEKLTVVIGKTQQASDSLSAYYITASDPEHLKVHWHGPVPMTNVTVLEQKLGIWFYLKTEPASGEGTPPPSVGWVAVSDLKDFLQEGTITVYPFQTDSGNPGKPFSQAEMSSFGFFPTFEVNAELPGNRAADLLTGPITADHLHQSTVGTLGGHADTPPPVDVDLAFCFATNLDPMPE